MFGFLRRKEDGSRMFHVDCNFLDLFDNVAGYFFVDLAPKMVVEEPQPYFTLEGRRTDRWVIGAENNNNNTTSRTTTKSVFANKQKSTLIQFTSFGCFFAHNVILAYQFDDRRLRPHR